ncbi:glycosyltransferase family 2 protein [Candidatus Daviesbacteria bacterium]|nr:glycosyltransferase family 2 protein [Candidatus Daviesbacteria bacterium]
MTKLSIIIPIFNEIKTIEKVLMRINKLKIKQISKEIIVVDDKSTDGTENFLKKNEKKYKFKLIKLKTNSGKGFAVRAGLKKVTGDIILIQDADLEYKIEEYPALLKPILKGYASFVIGSRHLLTNEWHSRQFLDSMFYAKVLNIGSILYSRLVNLLYGINITDPGTAYKVFKKECLTDIKFRSKYFDIDWEMIAKFTKKGILPYEVPISYRSRSPKEGKKIRIMPDGFLIFWAIIKYRFID